MDSSTEDDPRTSSDLHADLLKRAQLLLDDLKAFQAYLQSENKEDVVDIRQFQSSVQSEKKSLERTAITNLYEAPLTNQDAVEVEIKKLHVLRSSNLPFYEAVWTAAGDFEGVTAVGKKIASNPTLKEKDVLRDASLQPKIGAPGRDRRKADTIMADIVADEGQTWVKVSTITEKRLLFEMAKEGWELDDDSEDDAESDPGSEELSAAARQESGGLEIVRLAENMKRAASDVRVRYRHPKIHLILPKITEGQLDEVDAIVEKLRRIGVRVHCAAQGSLSSDGLNGSCTSIRCSSHAARFPSMLPKGHPPLTPTLNIDCTILLALISDISHLRSANLPQAPNGKYHSAIMRQVRSEETTPLLQSELYPLLIGRQLQCTEHAAQRMREIVQTMGTAAEKERAGILLGEGPYQGEPETDLRRKLEDFSDQYVPAGLCLPLKVFDFDFDTVATENSSLVNRMMSTIAQRLSEINQSVFFYGWSRKIVTISSNRVVAKEIEQSVCQLLDDEEAEHGGDVASENTTGPDIWICRTARSLIGKEKGRREG